MKMGLMFGNGFNICVNGIDLEARDECISGSFPQIPLAFHMHTDHLPENHIDSVQKPVCAFFAKIDVDK